MKNLLFPLIITLAACTSKQSLPVLQDTSTTAVAVDSAVVEDEIAPEHPDVEELDDADYGIYHYTFRVRGDMPVYALKFHIPDEQIYIYDNAEEKGTPLLTVGLSVDLNYEAGYFAENPEATFTIADYNFDGYRDVEILKVAGTANTLSDFYVFNPANRSFNLIPELSDISSIERDSVNKQLVYHNLGGMGGAWYTEGIFSWQNGKPVLIREEEQSSQEGSEEIFIRTIFIVDAKGNKKVASKVRISAEGKDKEKQCLLEGDWQEFDRYPKFIYAASQTDVVRDKCVD